MWSMVKKVGLMGLVVLNILSISMPIYAVAEDAISPYYLYTHSVTAGLDISSSGSADCYGRIIVYEMSSDISLNVRLQKKEGATWILVKKWSKSISGARQLIIDEAYTVPSEGTYRVIASGIVTDVNGDFETVSCTTSQRTYP